MLVLGMALLPQTVAATDKTARVPAAKAASPAPLNRPAQSLKETHSDVAADHHHAYFGNERASRDARHIADWVVDSADNRGMPFVIVDKTDAQVFVFDAGRRIKRRPRC
jgi:hypothetical protein